MATAQHHTGRAPGGIGALQRRRKGDRTPPRAPADFLADMEKALAITPRQAQAWEGFAATLESNACRMRSLPVAGEASLDALDLAFGTPKARLAALDSMRAAAADLFAVLSAAQQRTAARVLPLCCLPARLSTEDRAAV
ncbi:MAG TPA: Spy/CpxP family protein refolding chaperone [Hyphomicrobiaceae bacterium]|nr:Spy/CpxP family protein refolding chaperone [Hyphomicrobiaceae bacterium]